MTIYVPGHVITTAEASHRSLRIEWDPALPAEIRASVEPLVLKYARLLPTWCRALLIHNGVNSDGALLEACSNPEYHWVRMSISTEWIHQSVLERDLAVRHEMLHAVLQPLVDMLHHTHQQLKKYSEEAAAALDDLRRIAMERVVCDLEEITDMIESSGNRVKIQGATFEPAVVQFLESIDNDA